MCKTLIALSMAITGWLAALPAQAALVLSISPKTSATTIGGNVSVDLVVSGLTASNQIVSGFDLDVFFNSSVLQANVLTTAFGPWGSGSNVILAQNFVAPGHVEFMLTALKDDAALAALQGDSVVLSTILFSGLSEGYSNLVFGPSLDYERNVVGRDSLSLPLDVQGACVTVGAASCNGVSTVPEPGTASLALLALLGAGAGVARRRSARDEIAPHRVDRASRA